MFENKIKGLEVANTVPFIHLKNIFDFSAQKNMLQKVKNISDGKIQRKHPNYEKVCTVDFFSSESKNKKIEFDEEIKNVVNQVGNKLDSCKNPFPKQYISGLMEVLKFGQDDHLEGHCDYVKGYGIIVSIGRFFF